MFAKPVNDMVSILANTGEGIIVLWYEMWNGGVRFWLGGGLERQAQLPRSGDGLGTGLVLQFGQYMGYM